MGAACWISSNIVALRSVRLGFWFPRQWTTGSDTEKQVHRLSQSNRVTDQASNNTFGACYQGSRRILLTRTPLKTGPDVDFNPYRIPNALSCNGDRCAVKGCGWAPE
jgi:hypothetical protein